MYLRFHLKNKIAGSILVALTAFGTAIWFGVTGKSGESIICLVLMGVFFIGTALFHHQVLQEEVVPPPEPPSVYGPVRVPYDVRPTGITAPNGTIWLPARAHGRVEALTDPRGESVCTVDYLDDGPGLPLRMGIRAPDGNPLGVLEVITPGRTFALVDGSGRTEAWLQGDIGAGGSSLDLRGAGGTLPRATVIVRPTLPPHGTVTIDRRTPVWQTLLCVLWVLECEVMAGPRE